MKNITKINVAKIILIYIILSIIGYNRKGNLKYNYSEIYYINTVSILIKSTFNYMNMFIIWDIYEIEK